MVKRCAYGLCKSDSRYPISLEGGVIFYPFPKPKTREERCRQWIKKCGRPHAQLNMANINKHKYVCSKHFVNGKPTADFPNPAAQVGTLTPTKEQQGGCRKPPRKRLMKTLQEASTSSTIETPEETLCVIFNETVEPPLLSEQGQLEGGPEEEQSTEKEKKLELENGSMSDKEIVRESGLIPLLEKQIEIVYLQRGDGLMADKGFLIEDDIKSVGLQLNLPPFARSKRQMPSGDVLTTKRIAKHRVHVEKAIAKIKKFKMVSDRIPNTRLGNISQIWYVVSVLSNFQPHILKQ
ncbi:52 kDa repressor of the inhibitor of the protein kinase [Dissostichus eleginoides]|uniref:52 kDa repressor of the inhibitor of the protein kinase n=1 Tax=Dissostichus eleginoides TaxID=100907 RepID=A0AAD9CMR3_DISEL|nr:52 kDa repressor of the inhibitor of the protein kinase [Dissostichus eleginoides]